MKLLAVDTTAASASAALCEDDFLLGEFYVNIRQTHSETLMPEISELLSRCGTDISQLGLFAVSSGPGSFTGVRIGVSAVKGMALPRAVPCAAVSTLEAAAMNLPCFEGFICPVMDARRSQFYSALFEAHDGQITRIEPDCAIGLEELSVKFKSLKKNVVLVGDGAKLCYNELNDRRDVFIAPERLRFQRASGVAAAGLQAYLEGKAVSPADLKPFYLRLPQAERELKKHMEVLGK